ncbi:MAG: hypothetical protein IJ471_06065 [Eubacterium sp.]|nr:hypothetical protein [Eubacterium sp.]
MAEHKKTIKMNIPMFLAAVLFCATLISIHFTSGLYARYTTSGEGSDSARVITFGDINITETGDFTSDGQLMIIPGVDLTKKAVVNFEGSESATYVFVEVIVSGWTKDDNQTFTVKSGETVYMQWSVNGEWMPLGAGTDLDDGSVRYVYYQELAPNTKLIDKDIIAELDATDDEETTIAVGDEITKYDINNLADVSIEFRATAVQSSGFDSASDAWDSIALK